MQHPVYTDVSRPAAGCQILKPKYQKAHIHVKMCRINRLAYVPQSVLIWHAGTLIGNSSVYL